MKFNLSVSTFFLPFFPSEIDIGTGMGQISDRSNTNFDSILDHAIEKEKSNFVSIQPNTKPNFGPVQISSGDQG